METVVKAIIVLIVLGVVIFVFMKLFGGGTGEAGKQIEQTKSDWDGDGIPNILDNCCCTDADDVAHVDATGCIPGENKVSCSSTEGQKCKPK